MEHRRFRELVTGPEPSQERVFFTSLWFKGHNNPRYAELLPRLTRLDAYLATASEDRIRRGMQYRAFRWSARARNPVLFALARPLNLLAIGEPTAAYLGISVERTKILAFAMATLLTAASVAVSGTIGFVGLIIPHAIRLLWGSDHRGLLPCAALAGAAFLAAADTLARSIAGTNELPIGIVTALIGVPCFVWLLRRPATR
jgi:hypothetical protein